MKHLILSAIFFASQLAWGSNAPIAAKGFADIDYKELRRIQAPHFQVTDLGKNVFLMETGNTNVWPNSEMEALTGSPAHPVGWAASAGLLNNNSGSNAIWGKSLAWLAAASGNTLTGPEMELSNDCYQKNCQVGAWIKTNVSGMKLRILNSSLTTLFEFDLPNTDSQFRYISFNFVPQVSLVRLRFVANATNDQLYLDSGYLGAAKNITNGAVYIPWISWTPTLNSNTNATIAYAEWARDGEDLLYNIRVNYSGVGANSTFYASLPNGLTGARVNHESLAVWNDSGVNLRTGFAYVNGNNLYFILDSAAADFNTSATGSSDYIALSGRVKISQWIDQGQQVLGLNTPLWKTNTLAVSVSNTGAVTSENVDWINGNCSLVSTSQFTCSFNSGIFSVAPICTVSPAASVSSNMSDQLVTISTSSFRVDTFSANAANAHAFNVHCERVGSDRVAVDMPLVTNSISTPDARPAKTFTGFFYGANNTTACSSGSCTMGPGSTSGVTVAYAGSSGVYNLTVPSGSCTTPLNCSFSVVSPGNGYPSCGMIIPIPTATTYSTACQISGAGYNSLGTFNCSCY